MVCDHQDTILVSVLRVAKKSPIPIPLCKLLYFPRYLHSYPSHGNNKDLLITCLDKIVRQLLNCCGCVTGNHPIAIVSNENGLSSLDDNNSFPAL